MNIPEWKIIYNSLKLEKRNFDTHLLRVRRGLSLDNFKKYPKDIKNIQSNFNILLSYIQNKLDSSFKTIDKKIEKEIQIDIFELQILGVQIKKEIAIVLMFYKKFWGNVDFYLNSIPWYFSSMISDILDKIINLKKDFDLIIFPCTGYSLEITLFEDEIDKIYSIKPQGLVGKKIFILNLPPYLILDPLGNILIFHEIGHYFAPQILNLLNIDELRKDFESEFREKYIDNYIDSKNILKESKWFENWITEILCDMFSIALIGPASFAATKEFLILEPDEPRRQHPPPSLRVKFLNRSFTHWTKDTDINQEQITEMFGQLIDIKEHPLNKSEILMLDLMKEKLNGLGLFYIDKICKLLENGKKELESDMLPIDQIPGKLDLFFDYFLALNCAWSLYLGKKEDLGGWRDKYNEIVLKMLEIEKFRQLWEQGKQET